MLQPKIGSVRTWETHIIIGLHGAQIVIGLLHGHKNARGLRSIPEKHLSDISNCREHTLNSNGNFTIGIKT